MYDPPVTSGSTSAIATARPSTSMRVEGTWRVRGCVEAVLRSGAMADDVLYETGDGVARVTINRPERRNAMSYGVMAGLRDAMARAARRCRRARGRAHRRRRSRRSVPVPTSVASPTTRARRPRTKAGACSPTCSATCGRSASRSSLACAATHSRAASASRARATSSSPPTTRCSVRRRSTSASGRT